MSDSEKPQEGQWAKVESIIRKDQQSISASGLPHAPLAKIEEATEIYKRDKLDFIGRYQAGKIQRQAAVEGIRAIQATQLEATKHALARALDVDKQRVDIIAKKYIFEITEEYLRDMRTMGMRNFQARMETLLQLNQEAARLLGAAEQQNVPQLLKDKTISAIFKKYDEFFNKLTEDEIVLK